MLKHKLLKSQNYVNKLKHILNIKKIIIQIIKTYKKNY